MSPGKDERRPARGAVDSSTAATQMMTQEPLTGIDRALAGVSEWDRARFEAAVRMFAKSGISFTIESVVEATGMDVDHPNRIGALTAAMAKAGVIRRVGYTKATRPSRAGGVVSVWVGVA
jgi:hypothetical protein